MQAVTKRALTLWIMLIVLLLALTLGYLYLRPMKIGATKGSKLLVPHTTTKDFTESLPMEAEALASPLPIEANETLMGTLSFDYDGDGFDDCVNYVVKEGSPYIAVVIGLYNSTQGGYEKIKELTTAIKDLKSFNCSAIDLTGDHNIELIYQGTKEGGESVFLAYRLVGQGKELKMEEVANIEAKGAIFIQSIARYESYELYHARGASFPIWAYSEDGKGQSIQTMYNWASQAGKYIQIRQTKLNTKAPASNSTSTASFLDGSIKGFTSYLEGLWYNMNGEEELRYIFFDYGNKEIIFLKGESEEIYTWMNSSLRHNGIFLSSINSSIQNLERKFDITIAGQDEILVKLQDDVRMFISEDSLWDGEYKKMSPSLMKYLALKDASKEYRTRLVEAPYWTSSDGRRYIFSSDAKCDIKWGDSTSFIDYIIYDVEGQALIQFRYDKGVNTGGAIQEGMYLLSYKTAGASAKEEEEGSASLLLTPVVASPRGIRAKGATPLVLNLGIQAPPATEQ